MLWDTLVASSLGNELNFNGVYSRNNLPKIKDEAYVINLDKFKSVGTHWMALSLNGNNINISRIQA